MSKIKHFELEASSTQESFMMPYGIHHEVYSYVKFIEPGDSPQYGRIAVIYDQDHDVRILGVVERMYYNGVLDGVVAIHERRGLVGILTDFESAGVPSDQIIKILSDVEGDNWSLAGVVSVRDLDSSCTFLGTKTKAIANAYMTLLLNQHLGIDWESSRE